MFKLLLISSVVLTGLFTTKLNPPVFKSAEGDALKTLIQGYVSAQEGKYTKKTEIRFSEAAMVDAAEYFHAGATALKRRTYYDETADALLMGDYAGGFTNINSGYAKNESDMEHYRYSGTGESAADFFTARNVTYVVHDTTPNAFFVNLSSIANEVASKSFVETAGVYEYAVSDITTDEHGDYNDALLHKIQYFAAPMLLQTVASAYLTPEKISFEESGSNLIIKIFVSEGDKGKIKDDTTFLAECIVSKGLILD